jgi:putative ABC transport system permease protein
MNLGQSILIALEMLRLHKLRAFLTMLGVIIGVMSVTIIVMVSGGFQHFMTNEFQKLGADTIMVMYDDWGRNTERAPGIDGLRMEDVTYLENRVSNIELVTPMVQGPTQRVSVEDRGVDNPRIFASNEAFLELNRVQILEGRPLDAADVRRRASVCLIGEELRDRLFPSGDAVGQHVNLPGIALEVVGVVERIDIMGQTTARDLYLPISTAQSKWIGGDRLMMIMTRPKPGVSVDAAQDAIWEALMVRSGDKKIYRVDSRESILRVFGTVFGVAGAVLAAIAALSLLVGGIGIMNIMLVSVTERTREIGLRKAVGAKQASILTQFVVEAATLSLVGGLIGMGIAYGLGSLVTFATASAAWPSAGGLPTPFPVTAGLFAALFSALIGIVFGLYPAMSAARLDPIDALRRE